MDKSNQRINCFEIVSVGGGAMICKTATLRNLDGQVSEIGQMSKGEFNDVLKQLRAWSRTPLKDLSGILGLYWDEQDDAYELRWKKKRQPQTKRIEVEKVTALMDMLVANRQPIELSEKQRHIEQLKAAIELQDRDAVESALKAGADANGIAQSGHSICLMGCSGGNREIVALLLASGALPDFQGLENAAILQRWEVVDLLLSQDLDSLGSKNRDRQCLTNAKHYCKKNGREDLRDRIHQRQKGLGI